MKHRKPFPAWVYLFVVNAIVLCFGFVLFISIILGALQNTTYRQTEQNLRTFSYTLSNVITYTPNLNFSFTEKENSILIDTFIKNMAQHDTSFRISIISKDGQILADSDSDPRTMEYHGNRSEVIAAMKGEEGSAVRSSSISDRTLIYYAIPIEYNTTSYVLRLSIPTGTTVFFATNTRIDSIISSLVVLLFALALSFGATRLLLNPLRVLEKAAKNYEKGDFSFRPEISIPLEFNHLAHSMNTMAKTIQSNIESISKQRDQIESLFANTMEAMFVFDENLRVTKYNDSANRVFNLENQNLVEKDLLSILRNTELITFIKQQMKLDKPQVEPADMEVPILTTSEEPIFVLARCTAISYGTYLLVLTNITRLKKLERIRQDFVANVSHELKTPITSILGFVETLKEGAIDSPETAHKFLDILYQQSNRLSQIVTDLLTLSKLEQNQTLPEKINLDVYNLCNSVVNQYTEEAMAKNDIIKIEIKADNLQVTGNPVLLEQALGNLIANAIAYCPNNAEITIIISLVKENSNPKWVSIAVEDTGPGIPLEARQRIFERFYRIDKGRSRDAGGTGLGLSIVRHIILIHGGKVLVEDKIDGTPGARFVFLLPVVKKTNIDTTIE
jgi:two-component system phosphate regulon sensor histidine kinase PhoR